MGKREKPVLQRGRRTGTRVEDKAVIGGCRKRGKHEKVAWWYTGCTWWKHDNMKILEFENRLLPSKLMRKFWSQLRLIVHYYFVGAAVQKTMHRSGRRNQRMLTSIRLGETVQGNRRALRIRFGRGSATFTRIAGGTDFGFRNSPSSIERRANEVRSKKLSFYDLVVSIGRKFQLIL